MTKIPIVLNGDHRQIVGHATIDNDHAKLVVEVSEHVLIQEIEHLFALDQLRSVTLGFEYIRAAPTLKED